MRGRLLRTTAGQRRVRLTQAQGSTESKAAPRAAGSEQLRMSTEPLTLHGDVENQNQLLDQIEEKLGGDLTDDERAFLLSSDDVKVQHSNS